MKRRIENNESNPESKKQKVYRKRCREDDDVILHVLKKLKISTNNYVMNEKCLDSYTRYKRDILIYT